MRRRSAPARPRRSGKGWRAGRPIGQELAPADPGKELAPAGDRRRGAYRPRW